MWVQIPHGSPFKGMKMNKEYDILIGHIAQSGKSGGLINHVSPGFESQYAHNIRVSRIRRFN